MPRIRRLLIANRGEIAARIARTARDLGIVPLGLGTRAEPEAVHLDACEESIVLEGQSPAETYLNIPRVLEAARRLRADAVHPGYGFLSERADFAQAVQDAGLVWVGPSPAAIAAMGGKVGARDRMIAAGVPVVPGTHDPAQAAAVGYPLMVKADAGGGGRGMRVVDAPEQLPAALASAQREAEAAFGSGRVFLERLVQRGRHVEVQVFGDTHGTILSLGERDCTVQRRHQKVVEESPSPGVAPALRARMLEAAVRAAAAVGYVGAGTVELLLAEDGEFYFLEMNTRLQVEHPVTELVTGVDLVAWQLHVAQGGALPAPPPVRGAAIEVRLYAEDPAQGGLPQAGRLLDWHLPPLHGVRLDAGVRPGSRVTPQYDPMLAKLIAWGEDREQARQRLVHALERLSVLGLRTNKPQLMGILEHPDFVGARVHTRWLEELAPPLRVPDPQGHTLARLAVLAEHLARPRSDAGGAPLLPEVPPGWRNSRAADLRLGLDGAELRYRPEGAGWRVEDGGASALLELPPCAAPERALRVDGHNHRVRVVPDGAAWWVHGPWGELRVAQDPDLPVRQVLPPPGSLVAGLNGRVLRVERQPGDAVLAGEVVLVLEAMKTEQALRAPEAGVVHELRVAVGDQVEAGQVLAVVG